MKRNKTFVISCILLVFLFGVFGCDKTDISEDVISDNVNNIKDGKIAENTQKEIIILEEVPDYISNRGVILRGKEGEHGRMDVESANPWYERYLADCNLSIESTDEELQEFVKNINEKATFPYTGKCIAGCISEYKKSGSPEYIYNIFKTPFVEDVSNGYRMHYFEEGMSCGAEVFYDPSGKYLLDTSCWGVNDEVVLKFLEPIMTEVKYNPDFLGMGEDVILTEAEDIEEVLDIMHSLELTLVKEDRSELAMAEYQSIVIFTDENGNINEYKIIGAYIVHGEEIYYVENNEKLKEFDNLLIK